MAQPIEISTEDVLEYNFFPNSSGLLKFRVRTDHDAHVSLAPVAVEANPMYEVHLGICDNTQSIIRKNRQTPEVCVVATPGILTPCEFRGFWIRWNNSTITCGHEGDSNPFLSYQDNDNVPINFVGVSTGYGSSGNWILEQPGPV